MSDNELFKIPEEALKKIRTQKEFEDFFQQLYKQGVEALLQAEINEHLGYPKVSIRSATYFANGRIRLSSPTKNQC